MDTVYRAADAVVGQELDALIDYSKSMLAAAKKNEWGEVAQIEEKRRIAMEQFFGDENREVLPPELLRSALKQLQLLETELVQLGMAAKEAMAQDISESKTSHQAVAAYNANQ